MSRPLKDHIWIWGHPENCLLEATGRESHVTPVGGVKYMDAANLFLNEYGDIHYDMKVENELAREVKRVGWCIDFAATNPENVSKVVEYAKEYRNIKIGMFDDFFSPTNPDNNYTNYTPEMLAAYRKQLHDVGVEMWAVVYTQNFDQLDKATLLRFMQEFDGLSLWFWEEELIAAGVSQSRGCHSGSQSDPAQDYAVCRLSRMPAVLIEMGFITSEEDNRLFEKNQSAYAQAITEAVLSVHEESVN